MRHAVVGVSGHDDIDEASGQPPRHVEDLGGVVTRSQVVWRAERAARTAGMRHHDNHLRTGRAQRRRLSADRVDQRRRGKTADVGGQGQRQRVVGHHADQPHANAGDRLEWRRPHIGPVHDRARRGVHQVGGQHRIARLPGARLERAARVAVGHPERPPVHRPELEVVVANCGRRVAKGVVGVDDHVAFGHVRLDPAEPGITGIEQHDAAAVGVTGRAQVGEVAAKHRQTAPAFARKHIAVQVGRADDRQGDDVRRLRCARGQGHRRRHHRRQWRQGDDAAP